MSSAVWMSSVLGNSEIGDKLGTRAKFYDHDWNPATIQRPPPPKNVLASIKRYTQGYPLQRNEMPEAAAVFDERRFERVRDIFAIGGIFVVKSKLAKALAQFDLGEGGLVEFVIYKSDLVTPYKEDFFLLNFGAQKNSIVPEKCDDARKLVVRKSTGQQIWDINYLNPDGEVALLPAALDGPDLWFEEAVYNKIFVKDALAQALIEIGLGDVFRLKPCRIIDSAQ